MKESEKPDIAPRLIGIALKKKQFEMAMQGDVPMLIHLGKKYLGQTENGPKAKRGDRQRPVGHRNQ